MSLLKQENFIPFIQPSGKGTALTPLTIDRHIIGDSTIQLAGVETRRKRISQTQFGIREIVSTEPSGDNTVDINWDRLSSLEYLDESFRLGDKNDIWGFHNPCGDITNIALADFLIYTQEAQATTKVSSSYIDGPGNANSAVQNRFNTIFKEQVEWSLKLAQTAVATGSAGEITCMAILLDPQSECYNGYAGPGSIMAVGTSAGEVYISINRGVSWAATAALPFAGAIMIGGIAIRITTNDDYQIIVGDGAGATGVRTANVTLPFLTPTVASAWTVVTVNAANEGVTALEWITPGEVLTSAGGSIYKSTDAGQSYTATLVQTNNINAIFRDGDGAIWAVGDANYITKREAGQDAFSTSGKTGPAGGVAFTEVKVSNDGILYAGNGSSLYKSINGANNAEGWTQLKDYGAGFEVRGIKMGNNAVSQLLRIFVDAPAGAGLVDRSADGGNSFVTEIATVGNGISAFLPGRFENTYFAGDRAGAVKIIVPST